MADEIVIGMNNLESKIQENSAMTVCDILKSKILY